MAGKSNKNRKYNRHSKSPQNTAYKMENRKRKNKIRKLKATLKQQPTNKLVIASLKRVTEDFNYGNRK